METLLQLERHLRLVARPVALDVLRLGIWLLLILIVFVPLERLFSLHPQRVFRKSFGVDLAYYFLNNLLPKAMLAAPIALVAWALRHAVPGAVLTWTAELPLPLRLLAALVVGELGFYWGHRWTHESPFLWRFHAVHHSAEQIDWLVNTRAHPLDIVFVRLCGFIPMYALGLAQPLKGQALDPVPLFVMLTATFWGFFVHANLRWRLGWLSHLVSTPFFHHWHHTNDEHTDKNYASMLPCMDWLFGTWYLPRQWPPRYGTNTPVAEGLAAQLANPLWKA